MLNALSDHMVFGYYVVITVTGVSVSLSLIAFLGTVIVHIYIVLKGRFNKCFNGKRLEEEEGHLPEGITLQMRQRCIHLQTLLLKGSHLYLSLILDSRLTLIYYICLILIVLLLICPDNQWRS